jgi:hypothetical protein
LRRRTLEDHFIDVVMRDEEAYSRRAEGMTDAGLSEPMGVS